MNLFYLRKILSYPRSFSFLIVLIVFLYFNEAFITDYSFYTNLFFYLVSFYFLKKFFISLLAYELKRKKISISFGRIRNIFLVNLPVFISLVGWKIIFSTRNGQHFLFFLLTFLLYLVLVYLGIRKHNKNAGRVIFILINNVFLISFSSLFFVIFLAALF